MGSSRIQSHQLSNGLFVSGLPEQQLKERPPTIVSRAVPYTGGDVKKSGELGKMFDISVVDPSSNVLPPPIPSKLSRPSTSSQHNSGSARSNSNSGQLAGRHSNSGQLSGRHTNSGPMNKKSSSGPIPIPPTGLITSGPLSGERVRRSGQLEQTAGSVGKPVYGSSVTKLDEDVKFGYTLPKAIMWAVVVAVAMGLLVGAFLTVAVKKVVILVAFLALLVPMVGVFLWNWAWGRKGMLGFVNRYPDAELRGAIDGQYVKVTGVVTCGSFPLESSYQRVSRCVYVSTELYEYRGCGGTSAYSWGSRHSEKHVADFYISDFQSGLRALVKAGYGAKVSVFVKPATVVDGKKVKQQELSPNFLRWLSDRSLSGDDRIMRLKEGYIKEGSTVSVMGVVRRHENVLMIVPPEEPISTGCQWPRCLLPRYIESLLIKCDETENTDVVPV